MTALIEHERRGGWAVGEEVAEPLGASLVSASTLGFSLEPARGASQTMCEAEGYGTLDQHLSRGRFRVRGQRVQEEGARMPSHETRSVDVAVAVARCHSRGCAFGQVAWTDTGAIIFLACRRAWEQGGLSAPPLCSEGTTWVEGPLPRVGFGHHRPWAMLKSIHNCLGAGWDALLHKSVYRPV